MSRYVTGVSEELEEESLAAMLHENMNLYRLMVHALHGIERSLKKTTRKAMKAKII